MIAIEMLHIDNAMIYDTAISVLKDTIFQYLFYNITHFILVRYSNSHGEIQKIKA
jgi:hypothetical protein